MPKSSTPRIADEDTSWSATTVSTRAHRLFEADPQDVLGIFEDLPEGVLLVVETPGTDLVRIGDMGSRLCFPLPMRCVSITSGMKLRSMMICRRNWRR